MELILDCYEVAEWLMISEATVKKMVREHEIPFIRIDKGLRFVASELERWFGFRFSRIT